MSEWELQHVVENDKTRRGTDALKQYVKQGDDGTTAAHKAMATLLQDYYLRIAILTPSLMVTMSCWI